MREFESPILPHQVGRPGRVPTGHRADHRKKMKTSKPRPNFKGDNMDNMISIIVNQYEEDMRDVPKWSWKDALALTGISILVVAAVAVLLLQIAEITP